MPSDFKPSHSGLHFPNKFPASLIHLRVCGIPIPVGNTKYGMCGGMVYASADYYKAGLSIPSEQESPSDTKHPQLFNYLKQRQVESITASDLSNYFSLMFTNKNQDADVTHSAWQTLQVALDRKDVIPLGLIRAKHKPWDMVKHHQVLAYDYKLDGEQVTLYVYDPRFPNDDEVTLKFTANKPEEILFEKDPLGMVYCLFCTQYIPNERPPLVNKTARTHQASIPNQHTMLLQPTLHYGSLFKPEPNREKAPSIENISESFGHEYSHSPEKTEICSL